MLLPYSIGIGTPGGSGVAIHLGHWPISGTVATMLEVGRPARAILRESIWRRKLYRDLMEENDRAAGTLLLNRWMHPLFRK